MSASGPLNEAERAVYEWQLDVPGFGEEGQSRLKEASVLVSRLGGLGGVVAYELAAAGIGRLVLAHGGEVVPSDLNRQLLMTHEWLGRPRIECATARLLELNPRLEIEALGENINEGNAARLVGEADVIVDCAPLFAERFLLNREAVRQSKPMVECAMYELEAHVTTILPGRTPCLACLFPSDPPAWRRKFPVFGAVSGAVGCLAAMEAIKLIARLGEPLLGRLLAFDTRSMAFHTATIQRRAGCPVCGEATGSPLGGG
ncbi:MAG: HesA/MoeB/ThiF family protein [Planctomycetota bacterium]|jgi:molybdopterin/thiamine biosynthesis adenylyltransferase|nr:HesA/MoeB/ThiF family protein [Planctomycetota bacterium]